MDRLRHLLLMLTALLCLGCNGDKDAEPRILTTEDLSQVRMATVISTVGEDYVLRNFPDQELQGYDDILGPIEALKTKRVDAVVTVYPNAQYALSNNPDLTLMPNALARRGLSFVVANGNTALRDSINRVILEMKADGTMDNIAARWMKPGKPLQEVPEIENVESDRVLRVGMSATYPPFAFIGANGRIIGYEAEMAQNMAKRMGMRVELSNIKFSGMISALQAGTVDVIASLQSPTDKPRHHVEFSEPYYECELVAIVRRPKKETMNLSTRKDLKGKCLGVVTGSCDELYAEEHCGDMTLLRVNNISGMLHALEAGQCDAAMIDDISMRLLKKELGKFDVLVDSVYSAATAMAFPADSKLRASFNRFLAQLKANGTYAQITGRWLDEEEAGQSEQLPAIKGKGDTLRVGVPSNMPGWNMIANGVINAMDIEILERFAASRGMSIQVSMMSVAELESAMQNHQLDVAAGGIITDDECQPGIMLSDAIYHNHGHMLTRKSDMAAYDGTQMQYSGKNWWHSPERIIYNNLIEEKRYMLIAEGLGTTVRISLLAAILGTLLGFVVCFVRLTDNSLIHKIADVYVVVLQGIPDVVWLMLCFYVIFVPMNLSAITVSIISFGLKFSVVVAEMLGTAITNIGNGQIEAGLSLGFSRADVFRYIIMPQAVRRALPSYLASFSELFKMTAIVGIIAITDLAAAGDIIRSNTFDAFFPLIVVSVIYFMLGWLITLVFNQIITRIDNRRRK